MHQKVNTWLGAIILVIIATTAMTFVYLIDNKKGPWSEIGNQVVKSQKPVPGTKPADNAQMANPASVNCIDNGGTLKIKTAPDGSQTGFCLLKSGDECEEWSYMRGTCPELSLTTNWNVYRNDQYGFLFKYPTNFSVNVGPESADSLNKEYLTLDIGTPEYLRKIESPMEGTEGVPIYLRVGVYEPKSFVNQKDCVDYNENGSIIIDGVKVIKCEGLRLGSFPTLLVNFSKDGKLYYSIESNVYSGEDKKKTDLIISTFKFTK